MSKGEHGGIRERGMAERRTRILDAAADLIRGGDVSQLTMRALSDTAGVSVPTVYNLVGGRDDVLVALLERQGAIVEAELAVLEGDPIDRCFTIVEHCIARATGPSGILRSVLAEGLGPVMGGPDNLPMRRYGIAIGQALIEAEERGDVELIANVRLIVEPVLLQLGVRLYGWAASDSPADPTVLQAKAAHTLALTLTAIATPRTRPALVERLGAAERTLHDLS